MLLNQECPETTVAFPLKAPIRKRSILKCPLSTSMHPRILNMLQFVPMKELFSFVSCFNLLFAQLVKLLKRMKDNVNKHTFFILIFWSHSHQKARKVCPIAMGVENPVLVMQQLTALHLFLYD